ncbi:MAG: DUF4232 domain-containing protein, partial [Candidatus Eremiobacteraeota bacterium]|nr:DUF4232 domain-containing protein [Candidatus Eremiobacteraeota bacterium]
MKKLLAATAVAASLALQACAGHSITPAVPYTSNAGDSLSAPGMTPSSYRGDATGKPT